MKIKFLGSGSAFVPNKENFQSNILIEVNEKNLLFDAGTDIAESLDYFGYKPQDLYSIFISHLHADHAGGIEYIGFKTYFETFLYGKEFGSMKPNLIGTYDVLNEGWEKTWRGGMQSIQGKTMTLEDYFDTTYLSEIDVFMFEDINFIPFNTNHTQDDKRFMPSYGLSFFAKNKSVFISGDTKFDLKNLEKSYECCDIIFHEVEFADYPNSVHSQFKDLCTLDKSIKEKMNLYHYSLGDKSFDEMLKLVKDSGFASLIKRGDEFVL